MFFHIFHSLGVQLLNNMQKVINKLTNNKTEKLSSGTESSESEDSESEDKKPNKKKQSDSGSDGDKPKKIIKNKIIKYQSDNTEESDLGEDQKAM